MERYVDATANEDFWSSHNKSDVTKKMMQWPGLMVNAKPGTCGRGKNNTIVFLGTRIVILTSEVWENIVILLCSVPI